MLDSLSILVMQKYLYADLYNLEETHWWHKAKRNLVIHFLIDNFKNELPRSKRPQYPVESSFGQLHPWTKSPRFSLNQNKKSCKILDVGCGTGKNIEAFSRFGAVWGIDSAKEALAFCKKRGFKNVTLGSIEKIPFAKESFDCVTALDVLEHVDDSQALKEIYRVLKKSGIIIATVPAFPQLWSRWDEVLHHKRRYTQKTLKRVLQRNEFEIVKISYMHSFLFLPVLIIRAIKNLIHENHYPSDFKLSNRIVNYLLENIANLEKFFIINARIPFGTSLIVVAEKY